MAESPIQIQGRLGFPVLPGPTQGGIYQPGMRSLLNLINNPGQTDQTMFNRDIAANQRSTRMRMASSRGDLAKRGAGGGRLSSAMDEAIKNSGINSEARIRANDSRMRDMMRREDVGLIDQYIQQPSLDLYGAERGVSLANQQAKSQKKQAGIAGAAALVGTLAAAFCHTADELYGVGSDEALMARWYMVKHASKDTMDAYSKGSKVLAEAVKNDPKLRAEVQPIFDTFVETARADFGEN